MACLFVRRLMVCLFRLYGRPLIPSLPLSPVYPLTSCRTYLFGR